MWHVLCDGLHGMLSLWLPSLNGLWMGNDQHCGGPLENTAQRAMEILRIQRPKTLVQNDYIGLLQDRTGNVQTAAFAMRQLPPILADHLSHSGRHTVEQVAQAQFTTHRISLCQVFGLWWPTPAHQQVESEGCAQHMVLVKLRHHNDSAAPRSAAYGVPVIAPQQQ